MSKSALASLTAQYTDSENEEGHDDESLDSQESQVIIPSSAPKEQESERAERPEKVSRKNKKKRSKKVKRLVSYQDDLIISDDDEQHGASESTDASGESSTESSEESHDSRSSSASQSSRSKDVATPMEVDDDLNDAAAKESKKTLKKADIASKYAHYGFNLPAEPKGKCNPDLQDKIRNLYDKMDKSNMDMNRIIQQRKEFRNPSIYEKLIQFCDINEFGTNYPPEIYNPLKWGAESYYEELSRVQQNEMQKRKKDRKDVDKIEQATALARKVEEEAKKRKSKWDQPAVAKPTVPSALTTTVTGTKGTVISAFGSLPKKPAV